MACNLLERLMNSAVAKGGVKTELRQVYGISSGFLQSNGILPGVGQERL